MKNARQLLEEFTALSFRDTQKAAEMFEDNGAFEMPYLESVGFPSQYQGREKIHGFFNFVRELFPDLQFHDVTIVCETPDVVVAEYEFTTPSSKTGRLIHQLFVGRLESANGKIKLLRESINLVELGLAIYANGLADYRAPVERPGNGAQIPEHGGLEMAGVTMKESLQDKHKTMVLEAFDTLFNRRDYAAAERFWSPDYIQHSAHIEPGRDGLFNLVKRLPPTLKYEPGVIVADGEFVIVHGRFSGFQAVNWIAADILRIKNGLFAEHWDVIQDEATKEESKSGLPMFGAAFPRQV